MDSDDDRYLAEVRAALQRAIAAGLEGDELLRASSGADPRLVDDLQKDAVRAGVADPHARARRDAARRYAAELPLRLPAPDPMASQWWFTLGSIESLSETARTLADDGSAVFLGAPTVGHHYAVCYDAETTILDADSDVVACVSGGIQVARDHGWVAQTYDVHNAPPEALLGRHAVAVVDPPWYSSLTRLFLSRARTLIKDCGFVVCVMPPLLTRPGVLEERTQLVQDLLGAGYRIVSLRTQVVTYDITQTNSTLLMAYSYAHDANGHVTGEWQQPGSVSGSGTGKDLLLGYTSAGRLSQYSMNASTWTSMLYDHDGNRTGWTPYGGVAMGYAYNPDDTIASSGGGIIGVYAYDAVGRMTSDGCDTYSYTSFDQVTAATPIAGRPAGCGTTTSQATAYDALGRAGQLTDAQGSFWLHYQGTSSTPVYEEQNGSASTIYQPDARGIATAATLDAVSTHYLENDGQGNVGYVTSNSQSPQCALYYDPYGSPVWAQSATNPCQVGSEIGKLGYQFARRAPETGHYSFGERTYDPAKGVFLTPDAYAPGSTSQDLSIATDPLTSNRYAYVNADPVNLRDPNGHNPCAYEDGGCTVSQNRALAASDRGAVISGATSRSTTTTYHSNMGTFYPPGLLHLIGVNGSAADRVQAGHDVLLGLGAQARASATRPGGGAQPSCGAWCNGANIAKAFAQSTWGTVRSSGSCDPLAAGFEFTCLGTLGDMWRGYQQNSHDEQAVIGPFAGMSPLLDLVNWHDVRMRNWDALAGHGLFTAAVLALPVKVLGGAGADAAAADATASGLGDLTNGEAQQIQGVVNNAGRPLDVVGSAARGTRGVGSDIDYTAPSSSHPYFQGGLDQLPGLDSHGLMHGAADTLEGPSIRFEPQGATWP